MYFYYLNYPLAMKIVEFSIADAENMIEPFANIIPKDKY